MVPDQPLQWAQKFGPGRKISIVSCWFAGEAGESSCRSGLNPNSSEVHLKFELTCSNTTYGDTCIKQGAKAEFDLKQVEEKEKVA